MFCKQKIEGSGGGGASCHSRRLGEGRKKEASLGPGDKPSLLEWDVLGLIICMCLDRWVLGFGELMYIKHPP